MVMRRDRERERERGRERERKREREKWERVSDSSVHTIINNKIR